MFMGGGQFGRAVAENGRFISYPIPDDFREKVVEIGRIACEEHYHVGRRTVDRWLAELGEPEKRRLLNERAALVEARKAEKRLGRKEMRKILDHAFPVQTRFVSPLLARRAARHLQQVRHGGWIVSPAGAGMWWLGSRRVTAAELVEVATRKGFSPTLTGDGSSKVE